MYNALIQVSLILSMSYRRIKEKLQSNLFFWDSLYLFSIEKLNIYYYLLNHFIPGLTIKVMEHILYNYIIITKYCNFNILWVLILLHYILQSRWYRTANSIDC